MSHSTLITHLCLVISLNLVISMLPPFIHRNTSVKIQKTEQRPNRELQSKRWLRLQDRLMTPTAVKSKRYCILKGNMLKTLVGLLERTFGRTELRTTYVERLQTC
jgi:hypothetical protein